MGTLFYDDISEEDHISQSFDFDSIFLMLIDTVLSEIGTL
jgi:hypothetical protein